MSLNKLVVTLAVWVAAITGLHLWLNFDWQSFLNDSRQEAERKLNVAYIPVT
jgi:hypothetical protein